VSLPPFEQVVAEHGAVVLRVCRALLASQDAEDAAAETFLSALRRVQLLVRDNTTPVRLAMRQGGVDLSVQSQDVGDAAETIDGDFSGEDLVIAFNPSYLIDGVEAVAGDEVIVESADASRAATVRGAEDEAFRYLLMPVRVS